MSRRLRYDIPGVDWRVPHSRIALRGIAAAFEPELVAPLSLVVEIGFCRGEFLMEMARRRCPNPRIRNVEYPIPLPFSE